MNWSVKTAIISAFVAVLLTACELPREIGLPTGDLVGVNYTDTLTVRASTVLLDSIRTSGATQMLVGSYTDPLFGKISSRAFVEFSPGSFNFSQDKVYQYDSVGVVMSYSSNGYYGDTLQPFEMSLHRLTDTLVTGKTYYNYNTTRYDPSVFAKFNFTPQSSNNTLSSRLPDDFGRQIFGLMFGSSRATNPSAFVREMKGFALIPSPKNKAIAGFPSESIQVILFFHENGSAGGIAYPLPLVTRRYNNIIADRKGTNIASLQPLKGISPQQLNGLTYIQDAVGVVTKLEIPYLSNLQKNGRIAINRAELAITPEPIEGYFPYPSGLVLAETDETNQVLRGKSDLELLVGNDGTTYSSSLSPQLVTYNSLYKNYNFVLTTYLQSIISGFKKTKGMMLLPVNYEKWVSVQGGPTKFSPYLNTKVSRMTIKPNAKNLKLIVFYTTTK
jgi:Domain of unknown function (DUF4270)